MRTLPVLLAVVCSLSAPLLVQAAAAQPPTPPKTDPDTGAPRDQRSPFDDVRFNDDDRAVVLVGGRWYLLESLAGDDWTLTWDNLRAASQHAFDARWRERIAKDLDAVLYAAGRGAGEALTITGRALDGPDDADPAPEITALPNIAHTRAKRSAVSRAYREWEKAAFLRALRKPVDPRPALGELVGAIRDLHAQGMRRGIDWDAALAAELGRLGDRAPATAVVHAAQRLVALTGDGHARVRQFEDITGGDDLPLAFVWAGSRWRGYAGEGGAGRWLWPADARDVRIDDVPVADWIAAASPYVAAGADHLVRRRSARLARHTGFMREILGLAKGPGDPAEVTWATPAGEPASARLPLSDDTPRPRTPVSVPVHPETDIGSRTLPGPGGERIALVRIASMGEGEVFRAHLHTAMQAALDCDGLIIDVRGNGGGMRDALLVVLPYLMHTDAMAFNVARPRLRICGADRHDADLDELLADRYLRPATWPDWLPAERAAVEALLAGFEPAWSPPEGWDAAGFGPWYVGVVSRERHGPDDAAVRARLPYSRPVAVLLDDGCFSATDIFLGAIEQLPTVTLIGTPSSGGSARAMRIRIDGPPRLTASLASIASFRPSGAAYDGAGIEPDITVEPIPEDYEGNADRVLETAVRLLTGQRE